MSKKRLQLSAFLAVFWMLILAVTLTTATYAWFTISAVTNVEPMSSAVSEGDANLLISSSKEGPFDKECKLQPEGKPDSLAPVSTSDLGHFYESTAQTRDGISFLYKDVTTQINTKVLHGTVYLRSEYRDCDVYLRRTGLDFGTTGQILAAMRLGLKITSESGTVTRIFRLDEMGNTGHAASTVTIPTKGMVVSSISSNGKASYDQDPSVSLSDYLAVENGENDTRPQAGREILVHLKKDEIAAVEFWLYMEGCDENCVNEAQQKDTGIQLSFAGVTKEDTQQDTQ